MVLGIIDTTSLKRHNTNNGPREPRKAQASTSSTKKVPGESIAAPTHMLKDAMSFKDK
jgi:hypothetical protein